MVLAAQHVGLAGAQADYEALGAAAVIGEVAAENAIASKPAMNIVERVSDQVLRLHLRLILFIIIIFCSNQRSV